MADIVEHLSKAVPISVRSANRYGVWHCLIEDDSHLIGQFWIFHWLLVWIQRLILPKELGNTQYPSNPTRYPGTLFPNADWFLEWLTLAHFISPGTFPLYFLVNNPIFIAYYHSFKNVCSFFCFIWAENCRSLTWLVIKCSS